MEREIYYLRLVVGWLGACLSARWLGAVSAVFCAECRVQLLGVVSKGPGEEVVVRCEVEHRGYHLNVGLLLLFH